MNLRVMTRSTNTGFPTLPPTLTMHITRLSHFSWCIFLLYKNLTANHFVSPRCQKKREAAQHHGQLHTVPATMGHCSSKSLMPPLDNSRPSDCLGPIRAPGLKETLGHQCYPLSFPGRGVGLLPSSQTLDLKAGKGRCLYPHWTQVAGIRGSGEVQGSPGSLPSFLFIVTFSSIDGSLNVNISQDS